MLRVRRGYVDVAHGQLHYFEAGEPTGSAPLYCLHATAYSGRTYLPMMRLLARRRRVIALDTPGYGASDPLEGRPQVADYAEAVAEGIRETGHKQGAVDLLGYHFGSVIALEIAARHPDLVRRIVLLGIPFFEGDERQVWRGKLFHETTLGESFDQFRHRWHYFVTQRAPGVPLARAFENFVDELRAYPREWLGYRALFEYDMRPRLQQVQTPVWVLNFSSPLARHSAAAAAVLPDARVCDLPQIAGAPLDLGAGLLSAEIELILDADS